MKRLVLVGWFAVLSLNGVIAQALEVPEEISILQTVELSNYNVVNTEALEFAPVFFEEGLLFIQSTKPDKKGRMRFNLKYHSLTDTSTQINFVEKAIEDLGHFGPCTYNRKDKEIYFSENFKSIRGSDKRYHMKLVRLYFDGRGWVRQDDFPYNNYSFSIMHPTISTDGKTLIFTSNMPGGYGKMDLYQSTKADTGWTIPMNLGPTINTAENDWFPHLYDDKYLYYATEGLQGMGGLDLFLSKKVDSIWTAPNNLGAPLNSEKDDLGFAMSSDGSYGFISSNRGSGLGQDDIYRFDMVQTFFIEEEPESVIDPIVDPVVDREEKTVNEYIFMISDKLGLQAIEGVEVFFVPIVSNSEDLSIEALFLKNKVNGKNLLPKQLTEEQKQMGETAYTKQDGKLDLALNQDFIYHVELSKEGYEPEQMLLDVAALTPETQLKLKKIIVREPTKVIVPSEPVAVALPIDFRKRRTLRNVKFASNSASINKRSANALSKIVGILNTYPQLKIELAAHTDVLGPRAFNKKISLQRAESARQFLIDQGIHPNRIRAKGYGESSPQNHCREGVVCTDDEHEANRRLEMIILD